MLKRMFAGVVVAVMFAGAAMAGPLEDKLNAIVVFARGYGAYERGDYAAALKLWKPIAELGYDRAQYYVGRMYVDGKGVPRDDAEAVKWFRRAAEPAAGDPGFHDGSTEAQASLGFMYLNGRGVPEDLIEAAKWYRIAAEKGDVDSQYLLGLMYVHGDGVPRDDAEAAKWFRRAADKGYAKAQASLGWSYYTAHGVLKDYALAYMWLNLAAAQGEVTASAARDHIARLMTPDQIAEAQRMARDWKPKPSR